MRARMAFEVRGRTALIVAAELTIALKAGSLHRLAGRAAKAFVLV